MNSVWVALTGIIVLLLGYFLYGKFIERRIARPDNHNVTPAHELEDQQDYSPARRITLFGHQFSSIAGAGPILGPVAAAMAFGWTGCWLWIVIGGIFIGAVHDYLAIIISIRHKGRSLPDLSGEILSPLSRYLFLAFVWITLVLVMAVFGRTAASALASTPQVIIPVISLIPISVLFSMLESKLKMNFWLATFITLALMVGSLVAGLFFPISLPVASEQAILIWFTFLMVYSLFVSVLPVWLLLRPRGYLSLFMLFACLVLGYAGLFLFHAPISTPAFVDFKSSTQGPIWPMLFITIACGSISGFHCLCSGGTTSKQLDKESDAKPIGFGSMILESILAILALLTVTAGLYWEAPSGMEEFGFAHFMESGSGGWITAFGTGYARFLEALGIPLAIGLVIGVLMIQQFVITSLETCVRLERYVGTEMAGKKFPLLRNKWVASLIPILVAYYLGATSAYEWVWPMFGSANQLVAALALLVISGWLAKLKRPTIYTVIPCIFMLCTTIGALLWQIPTNLSQGNPQLSIIGAVLVVLACILVKEAIKQMKRMKSMKYVVPNS
jgi:carbon starvation protein